MVDGGSHGNHREKQRRTYSVNKERRRVDVCWEAQKALRTQRAMLALVGADAAANAIRVALKSVGGALRHAEHRLRFAESIEDGAKALAED